MKFDRYQTFSTNCGKCGVEEFKVRIRPDEKDSEIEHCIPECVSCANNPKLVNIDNKGNLIGEDERILLIEEDSIRKTCCEKCGSITFKIKQSVGGVIYCCTECDNELEEVEYEKYQTLLPSCGNCSEDIFRVIIEADEEDDTLDHWRPECIKCKGTPKPVYVDNEYKLINYAEREILIMKDRIEELETEVEDNEVTIEELNDTIENKDRKIYRLKDELDDAEETIYKLKSEISDLEDDASDLKKEVSNLNDEIYDLKNEISNLEWELNR